MGERKGLRPLIRPDGARIHYEVRGEGPLAVLSLGFASTAAVYGRLIADLERDHTVVTWDPRGCGRSAPQRPFDLKTDGGDLSALIDALGGRAKVFGAGHGVNICAYAVGANPDSMTSLLGHGITTALLGDIEGGDGMASSRSVVELLLEQFRRDPRGSVRSLVGELNPQMDEQELRARVDAVLEYAGIEPTLERIETWLEDPSARAELQLLGDRLYVLAYATDLWQAGTEETIAEALPEAQLRHLEDGPISRPDLTAELIRAMP